MKIKPEKRLWIAVYGSTAFIMLVAMAVFGWLIWSTKDEPGIGRVAGARPANTAASSIPDERYEALAAFEAPEYAPQPGQPKPFQNAMAFYAKRNYAGAASALRAVTNAQPDFAPARFYLGISLLLSGDRIAGIQELSALTMDGDSAYLERARFYLAKGMIAEHDEKRAQKQLQDVVEQHGQLESQATALLAQIRSSS